MTLTEPEPDDTAPWTDATRARLAVSMAAQELADSLAGWVPISPNELSTSGSRRRSSTLDATSMDDAERLRSMIDSFIVAVAVYEVIAGATFEMIGEDLGISRQSAHARYADAVADFKARLAEPYGVHERTGMRFKRLPPGADDPDYWGPRLDAWYRQHRRDSDPHQGEHPVTGGMTRLHPHLELMDLQARRYALMTKHILPPAEEILPIAERELVLWKQMGAAGHDVDESVERMQRQITELRATLAAAAAAEPDGAEGASA
jgi:hypothetical protein